MGSKSSHVWLYDPEYFLFNVTILHWTKEPPQNVVFSKLVGNVLYAFLGSLKIEVLKEYNLAVQFWGCLSNLNLFFLQ